MHSTVEDMSKVLLSVNHTDLIAEARYFLTEAHSFMKPEKLNNIKEDWNALFAIYKQYMFTYAMSKVQEISARCSQHQTDRCAQLKHEHAV